MSKFSYELFDKMPLIGIMRNVPHQYMMPIGEQFCKAGLTCLEVTMNSPDAEKSISELTDQYGDALNIGAGTVCNLSDLQKALAAGAQFIVTPIINEEVIIACVDQNIPIFPGAYTPSEMYRAWSLGARLIKLFPSGDLKPGYIKEILAPLNFLNIMPTGGMNLDNFTNAFAEGARAIGLGSNLFPKDILAREDWEALASVYRQFTDKYNAYVSGR